MQNIHRTLKRVIDLDQMRVMTSDDLLALDIHQYDALRRDITIRHQDEKDRYVCEQCGFPVYSSNSINKRPYWSTREVPMVDR